MQSVDARQQRFITFLTFGLSALTVFVGYLTFRENKKDAASKKEVLGLDKQIKTLELNLKKHQAEQAGLI